MYLDMPIKTYIYIYVVISHNHVEGGIPLIFSWQSPSKLDVCMGSLINIHAATTYHFHNVITTQRYSIEGVALVFSQELQ